MRIIGLILLLLLLAGCQTTSDQTVTLKRVPVGSVVALEDVRECIQSTIDYYNDTCSGPRRCDRYGDSPDCTDEAADKRGSATLLIDAHFEGVACAATMLAICVGLEAPAGGM